MRILFVAWYYPPLQGTGVFRTFAITQLLAEQGHDVTVIAPDSTYFETSTPLDLGLAAAIHPNIKVRRVPFPDIDDPIINRWDGDRALNAKAWKKRRRAATTATFPEPYYGAWRDRIVGAAHRLQRLTPFDLVIATGSAYVDYVVADALHTHHGVPFLIDDRDSFMFDVYDGSPRPNFERIRHWWESLASRALEVWFVNPPLANLHREAYPGLAAKIQVVENGWDRQHITQSLLLGNPTQQPVFTYLGAMHSAFRWEELLTAWAVARLDGLPENAELRMRGNFGSRNQATDILNTSSPGLALASLTGLSTEQQLRLLGTGSGVQILGSVPKSGVMDVYQESSVLVFFKEGRSLVTSSKIYEYMSTGLPIVAVVSWDHDSRRVLAGYPRVHFGDLDDPRSWSRALLAAHQDSETFDSGRRKEAQEWAVKYRRDRILEPALERVMSNLPTS